VRNFSGAIALAANLLAGVVVIPCPTNFIFGSDGLCHPGPISPCQAGLVFGNDGVCHPPNFQCQTGYVIGLDGVCHPA